MKRYTNIILLSLFLFGITLSSCVADDPDDLLKPQIFVDPLLTVVQLGPNTFHYSIDPGVSSPTTDLVNYNPNFEIYSMKLTCTYSRAIYNSSNVFVSNSVTAGEKINEYSRFSSNATFSLSNIDSNDIFLEAVFDLEITVRYQDENGRSDYFDGYTSFSL